MFDSPLHRFAALAAAVGIVGTLAAGVLRAQPATAVTSATVSEALFHELRFREIGPAASGGRIADIAVVEQDPRTIYLGVASGGVWKTVDAGTTWRPIFDGATVASIGDVAIAPSDPDVVWVGTGEGNSRQNIGQGDGVYVSLDAGETWKRAGLERSRHIGRIAIHPRDPRTVFVAAQGPIWRTGGDRGLFRTSDGGATWTRVLDTDEETGVIDVAIDPRDPQRVFASTYRTAAPTFGSTVQQRWPSGDGRNRLHRSIDGGRTWQPLLRGLPDTGIGRIAIDIYRSNPQIIMAVAEGENGGVYRSENGGDTWVRQNAAVRATAYIAEIRIDPNDDARVWVAGADPLYYSADGGKTFCSSESEGSAGSYCERWLERIHFDTHAIWINPADSSHMMTGNDGGFYQSYTRGTTWQFDKALPLAQFHQIGADNARPYNVYGGMQDTGTWTGPSRSLHTIGILNEDWYGILVGDGYYALPDPHDPNTVYAEFQGGRLFRLDRRTNERRDIRPAPAPGAAPYAIDSGNHPLLISPHDHRTLYFGGNRLFISSDRGDTWRETEELSGRTAGPTISAIAESPRARGVLWVGTTMGIVQVSRDGGATWKDVTASVPAPGGLHVTRIEASSASPGRAYLTLAGHWRGDDRAHLYVTEDSGETWRTLAPDLPEGAVAHVVREHPRNPDLLFLGTERGLWATWSRGAQWTRLTLGLPPVRVHDLLIHPRENDLVVGTHGRGFFILDDIAALEGLTAANTSRPLSVFAPRTATMWRLFNHQTNLGPGDALFVGRNPAPGASLDYFLSSDLEGASRVRLEIADAAGRGVHVIEGPGTRGVHRVTWDLRYRTPFRPPAGIRADPPGQPGGPRMRALALSQGPYVLPGKYTVRVTAGAYRADTVIEVAEDPRITAPLAALRAHRTAWHALTGLWVDGNTLVSRLDAVSDALESHQNIPASADVSAAINATQASIAEWRARLAPRRRVNALYRDFLDPGTSAEGPLVPMIGQLLLSVGGWTGAPTPGQSSHLAQFERELSAELDRWNRWRVELERMNARFREAGQAPFVVPAPIARASMRP